MNWMSGCVEWGTPLDDGCSDTTREVIARVAEHADYFAPTPDAPSPEAALKELKSVASVVKVLGSFPVRSEHHCSAW